jgi:hypothetical protein
MYIACSHLTRFSLSLRRGVKFPAAARQAPDTRVHLTSAAMMLSSLFDFSLSQDAIRVKSKRDCCGEKDAAKRSKWNDRRTGYLMTYS